MTFAKGRLPELLFLVMASSALFCTVTYGFHVEDALRTAYPAILGWTALLMVAFTACSYSLRTVVVGAPVTLVAGIVVVAAASAASGFGFFDDAFGNTGFFLLIGFVTAALSYLLTRRRALALVYLVGGIIVCAFVQFLYRNGLLWQMLVFAVFAAALFMWSMQRKNAGELAQGAVSAPVSLLTGAGLCCLALLLSCGVYFAAIAPLNPPSQELKLITKLYALEEIPVSGVSKLLHQQNENLLSENGVEGDDTSSETDSRQEEVNGLFGDDSQGSTINGFDAARDALRYFVDHPLWLLAIPAAIVLVLLVIALRRWLRTRRYNKMCALDPPAQVRAFYFFFEERLKRFGIEVESTLTPLERARASAQACSVFEAGAGEIGAAPASDGVADGEQGGGVREDAEQQAPHGEQASYARLARDYCSVAYGCSEPGPAALENCRALYRVFYKNACQSIGRPKYAFTKFFLI